MRASARSERLSCCATDCSERFLLSRAIRSVSPGLFEDGTAASDWGAIIIAPKGNADTQGVPGEDAWIAGRGSPAVRGPDGCWPNGSPAAGCGHSVRTVG